MTYEELKAEELRLAEKLSQVRKEIAQAEEVKAINLLGIAIKSLEEAEDILANPDCYFEVYCEECETEFDTQVSLADIIQSLRDLREGVR